MSFTTKILETSNNLGGSYPVAVYWQLSGLLQS